MPEGSGRKLSYWLKVALGGGIVYSILAVFLMSVSAECESGNKEWYECLYGIPVLPAALLAWAIFPSLSGTTLFTLLTVLCAFALGFLVGGVSGLIVSGIDKIWR